MGQASVVLLVEDNEDDVFFFERALSRHSSGLSVRAVPSCAQAVEYLQGQGKYADREANPFPKFILTDNCRSPLSAAEFLGWLRSHPDCRVIPTVILSGSGSPSQVKEAFNLGAHSFFQKPGSIAEYEVLLKLIFDYWSKSLVPPDRGAECGS